MKKLGCIVILFIFCLTGCNKTNADQTKNKKNNTVMEMNNYGRKIEIAGIPKKVITMGPNTSELFCELGLAEKVVGNTLNNHSRGPLAKYKKEYNQIPELTHGSATREAVIASGADFIYGIDWEFGSEGLSLEELQENGITVYQNKAKTIDEVYQEIADIGTIFNVKKQASSFIAEQKERLIKIAEQSTTEPVNVLVYDSGDSGIFTASGSNYESRLIEAAGGKNIFADLKKKDWITVSMEEVLKRQPEVIVIHDYDQPSVEEKIQAIENDPFLAQLPAVQEKRFICMSLENALPGPRLATTVELLAKGFTNVK